MDFLQKSTKLIKQFQIGPTKAGFKNGCCKYFKFKRVVFFLVQVTLLYFFHG